MLVLSRKLDERIMIGEDVCITIVDIRGDKVRIGIDAPKGVVIDREEIFLAKKKEIADAKNSSG